MFYPLTYLYLLCLILVVVCVTLVVFAVPTNTTKRYMVLAGCFLAGWTVADFLSNMAESPSQVRYVSYVCVLFWGSLPYIVLRASLIYAERRRLANSVVLSTLLALPAVGMVYLVYSGRLYSNFLPASANGAYFQSHSTWWQMVVNLYLFTYVGAACAIVLKEAHNKGQHRYQATGRLLLFGLGPIVLFGGVFNGVVALFEIYPPYVTTVLMAGFSVLTTRGILQDNYFVPLERAQCQRDQMLDSLHRREAILEAIPVGVAIVEPKQFALLYANSVFAKSVLGKNPQALPQERLEQLENRNVLTHEIELEVEDSHVILTISPVDYSGHPSLLIVLRDVTKQKQAQRELVEQRQQLQQSQKMEAIGRLSAGVAHDFNNQLTAILNYTDFIRNAITMNDPVQEDITEVLKATERARVLTQQLLTFARKHVCKPITLDVNQVFDGIQKMLARLLGSPIRISTKKSPEPAWIKIDRVQLEQVFMTLATNARDAMPRGGDLVFEVHNREQDVQILVQDTGCGMDEQVAARIFEPFFTTKGEMGSGLGLATTYGLITGANGTIRVDSQLEKGTTFDIQLPRAAAPSVEPTPQHIGVEQAKAKVMSATVLLVDDEEPLRRAVKRILSLQGYHVLVAKDGTTAMQMFALAQQTIDLLITDLTMPGFDGAELAKRVLDIRPDLPVLFMSGHIQGSPELLQQGVSYIEKPFKQEDLLLRVWQVLEPTEASS